MEDLTNHLSGKRTIRASPVEVEEAKQRLEKWNIANLPPLTTDEFTEAWKSLLASPQYNYGCHDDWFSRNCHVLECPLMREKISILFGDFTPDQSSPTTSIQSTRQPGLRQTAGS
jgi:hypothetical protein